MIEHKNSVKPSECEFNNLCFIDSRKLRNHASVWTSVYLCQTLSSIAEFSELPRSTEVMTFGTINALRLWEDEELLMVWLRITTGLRIGAFWVPLSRVSNFLQRFFTLAASTVSLKETFFATFSADILLRRTTFKDRLWMTVSILHDFRILSS